MQLAPDLVWCSTLQARFLGVYDSEKNEPMGENNIFLSNDVFYCLEIKLDLITFDKSS